MNYYRRYVGDFQADTGDLSLVEIGCYDRLLDHYYATAEPIDIRGDVDGGSSRRLATTERAISEGRTEGRIGDEGWGVLCRICRAVTAQEIEAVKHVVAKHFNIGRDRKLHNSRADHEISMALQAQENGSKGGRPKGKKDETGTVTGSITGTETGTVTGEGAGSGHPPTTNHQPPTFLTSKPPTPSSGGSAEADPELQKASMRGTVAKTLRDEGVTGVTPSHPQVVEWVESGVTVQTLREAIDLAREQKPKPAPIPVAYLKPIVERLLSRPERSDNSNRGEPVDKTCCNFINGQRCGKPGAFGNVIGTKFHCRDCGPM